MEEKKKLEWKRRERKGKAGEKREGGKDNKGEELRNMLFNKNRECKCEMEVEKTRKRKK